MTTQINVIVDNGGLSAKAKQQTQANRWAKLEKDGKELVYRRASNEREDALARVGLDPKGNPLYGTSPQLQVRRDEPAAARVPTGDIVLRPSSIPLGTTAISALTSAAGASESAASTALRYKEKFGSFYVINDLNGPITSSAAYLFQEFGPSEGLASIARPNGLQRFVAQTKGNAKGIKSGSIANATIEAWVYIPATPPASAFGQVAIELLGSNGFTNAGGYKNTYRSVMGLQIGMGTASSGLVAQYLANYLGQNAVELTDSAGASLPNGQWSHIAAHRLDSGIEYFFNGTRVHTVLAGGDGLDAPDLAPALASYSDMVFSVRFDAFEQATYTAENWWAIRGIRYTSKQRYDSAGFTPENY